MTDDDCKTLRLETENREMRRFLAEGARLRLLENLWTIAYVVVAGCAGYAAGWLL